MWDPMNPAPPVTRIRMVRGYGRPVPGTPATTFSHRSVITRDSLAGRPESWRSAPPGPGGCPQGRVEAVEEVGDRHHQHQAVELTLVVVTGRVSPDFVGDRARPVSQPGHGLGQGQGGPLGIVEDRVLVPRGQG